MTTSIQNVAGTTFNVGDRVKHQDGWTGVVTRIDPARVRCLFVTPDHEGDVPAYMRWALNPDAAQRAGRATYCEPRDSGLSMGHYEVLA